MSGRGLRPLTTAFVGCLLLLTTSGCSSVTDTLPACTSVTRLAVVAQSVPSAAYLPCLRALPTGWESEDFDPTTGGTRFTLLSDRADGRTVDVRLQRHCDVTGASPEPPRTVGGRTYLRLRSISPRFSGTLYDVFPGGCVSYQVDFARGPHIALMEQLQAAVGLVPRRQLRLELRHQLGVELDP